MDPNTRQNSNGGDHVDDFQAEIVNPNPLEEHPMGPKLNAQTLKTLQQNDLKVVAQSVISITPDVATIAYKKILIEEPIDTNSFEYLDMFKKVKKCMDLRTKYQQISCQIDGMNPKDDPKINYDPSKFVLPCDIPVPDFPLNQFIFEMKDGVFRVYETGKLDVSISEVPSVKGFFEDLDFIIAFEAEGPIKTYAYKRLNFLQSLFDMHLVLNEVLEQAICKAVPHRDFYNVRKVDTHVHHSSCMNQKHLLRFIKSKMRKNADDIVIFRDGKHLSLQEVFQSLNLTAYDLSIDTLDMHAHKDSFQRFDKFNLKYNPLGESRLREIFLKIDNFIKGRYLAELTKQVISDLEESKYQMAEYRVSIYGRDENEWYKLADWFCENKVFSPNVRWLIQVPRLYQLYRSTGVIKNFEEFLTNIFKPLFDVTLNPQKHPNLHKFLTHVVGFDSVDDESKANRRLARTFPLPKDWDSTYDPPYSYYLYYMYANMTALNQLRLKLGENTFLLRPHAGEAGPEPHENLTAAFLLSHSINHGILLKKVPALQYLYYLMQIGLAVSPLSNNSLFLAYDRNPFPDFFKRGLNVSVSTDDPLQFHFTKEPLIEEYSVAAQIWKLSPTDMCEIARNSVLQSGFELCVKKTWIGENCILAGPTGNDIQKTNVPNLRLAFRHDTLMNERNTISKVLHSDATSSADQLQAETSGILKRKINDITLLNRISATNKRLRSMYGDNEGDKINEKS